jgi:mannose-6-phosphate isomerase-like protein (cupin superfamily)
MAKSKLEQYIRRDVRSDAQQIHPEVIKPVLGLHSDQGFGNLNFSLSWWPITKPFEMVSNTHKHDFDQFLCFVGGDITNMVDLGGEVELTLSEDGTIVYIPKGLYHCPLNFKKVNDPNKPILFHDLFFTSEYERLT